MKIATEKTSRSWCKEIRLRLVYCPGMLTQPPRDLAKQRCLRNGSSVYPHDFDFIDAATPTKPTQDDSGWDFCFVQSLAFSFGLAIGFEWSLDWCGGNSTFDRVCKSWSSPW